MAMQAKGAALRPWCHNHRAACPSLPRPPLSSLHKQLRDTQQLPGAPSRGALPVDFVTAEEGAEAFLESLDSEVGPAKPHSCALVGPACCPTQLHGPLLTLGGACCLPISAMAPSDLG